MISSDMLPGAGFRDQLTAAGLLREALGESHERRVGPRGQLEAASAGAGTHVCECPKVDAAAKILIEGRDAEIEQLRRKIIEVGRGGVRGGL